MKKLLLSLLFALVALTGLQAQTIWNGTADTSWYDATSTNFEISTAEQLAGLAELVNNGNDFSGKTILLTADIVLNDTSDWENWENSAPKNSWSSIGSDSGNSSNPFSGTFDGQGHTVSGIYINSENDYQGLFGYNEGTIKNIGVTESYIKGDYCVGGVCGLNNTWRGTISNCYNSGAISGNEEVGGVCGGNYSGSTISYCYNSGPINGTGEYTIAGGVCGENNGTISNSYNSGTVIGNRYVGGVCGSDSYGTISNCYNTGTISGNLEVGGVCGWKTGTISNCYNTGTINGDENVGGVCGFSGDGSISNCYNTGTINGDSYVGGVCGYNGGGTISNCYYLQGTAEGGINGNDVSGQAEVKSAEQFTSGEVCWLLNGSSDENPVWFQSLDTDDYPVLDDAHSIVYAKGKCPNSKDNTYSNQGPSQVGAHTDNDNDGRCDFCGKIMTSEPAQKDGVYQISNRAELYWFAGLVNGTLSGVEQNYSANAVLTADIIINENVLNADGSLTENSDNLLVWSPIGNNMNVFYGSFDGQGHTVSGVYINSENKYQGLFGHNEGTIKNVGITESYIKGNSYVGGVCGRNIGTISNCYNSGNVNGYTYVGGVCGENYSTISNCYNSGIVSGDWLVGSVCGDNWNGTISNCYYLEGTATGGINGSDVSGQAEVKSAEQLASGEVCWLLNEEQSEGAWGQKLDTDPYPVLGGPAVFKDGDIYYNEKTSAIEETNNEQASFVIVSENLTINIYGNGHEATVFNLAGIVVYHGSERIIPVHKPGIYMVRIGNEVQKTIVR